jgi:hypothetical protein
MRITASKWTLDRRRCCCWLVRGARQSLSTALQDQRQCSRYVDLFLDRTEHAPAPGTSQASHGNFEIAEAGQLELSNRDKELAKKVLHICEQEGAAALARAKRAMKPWWKRII